MPLSLGSHRESLSGSIGQGKQGREQRQLRRQSGLLQRLCQPARLDLWGIFSVEMQQPLQIINHGIECAVLVVRGTAQFHQSRCLFRKVLLERLQEARLAGTGLATEQHDLPGSLLGALPPFH